MMGDSRMACCGRFIPYGEQCNCTVRLDRDRLHAENEAMRRDMAEIHELSKPHLNVDAREICELSSKWLPPAAPPDPFEEWWQKYVSGSGSIFTLLDKQRMRDAWQAAKDSLLTPVEKARRDKVCRICGGPDSHPLPFVFDYGMEYAHADCLDAAKARAGK